MRRRYPSVVGLGVLVWVLGPSAIQKPSSVPGIGLHASGEVNLVTQGWAEGCGRVGRIREITTETRLGRDGPLRGRSPDWRHASRRRVLPRLVAIDCLALRRRRQGWSYVRPWGGEGCVRRGHWAVDRSTSVHGWFRPKGASRLPVKQRMLWGYSSRQGRTNDFLKGGQFLSYTVASRMRKINLT